MKKNIMMRIPIVVKESFYNDSCHRHPDSFYKSSWIQHQRNKQYYQHTNLLFLHVMTQDKGMQPMDRIKVNLESLDFYVILIYERTYSNLNHIRHGQCPKLFFTIRKFEDIISRSPLILFLTFLVDQSCYNQSNPRHQVNLDVLFLRLHLVSVVVAGDSKVASQKRGLFLLL